MEFTWNALGNIFSQAGLRKNVEEDRWEFVKGDASSTALASAETIVSDKVMTTSASLADNMDDSDKTKKKKNRGRKKRGNSQDLTNAEKEKSSHHVSWGTVDEILFERGIGFDCVPTKGEYPLGLGNFVEICTSSVDELFSRRQYLECLAANQELSAQSISKKKKPAGKKSATSNARKDSYDHHADSHATPAPESLTSEELKQLMDAQVIAEADRIRKLSDLTLHHNAHHNDVTMTPTVLEEINHEILSIRNSREHVGCTCKVVKVDKMNVNQLKAKLHQFEAQLPPNTGAIDKMKKADLVSHVKEFVKDCKQCIDHNCECVRLEIPCSYFGCDCMKGSPSDCNNDFGKDSLDADRIDLARKQVLIDWKVREANDISI